VSVQVLIAGGGIGGLAAALALTRGGHRVRLFEQAPQWGELGAGVQLGPNATRLFADWGLATRLKDIAAAPCQVTVRRMKDGAALARMRLGETMRARYGAPYFTVHRGDLHALLLQAARSAGAALQLDRRIAQVEASAESVQVRFEAGEPAEGEVLVGADGVWSRVREQLLHDGMALPTGHLAYRAMVPQTGLPATLRSRDVAVWLGAKAHVVAYPVRRGEWLNVVAFIEGERPGAAQDWDQQAHSPELLAGLGRVAPDLAALVQAPSAWRLWSLHDRPPLQGAAQMARGRVALLGDAAHPMLPYLAQGAAMALEDAAELATAMKSLQRPGDGAAAALQAYAQRRWARCARVQRRARRNGAIFHAMGPVRWSRDLSLRLLGERLLDVPWLYEGGAG